MYWTKRYYVAIWTKRGFHSFSTDSLRLAMNPVFQIFARVIKVTDHTARDVVFYRNRKEES